MLVALVCLVGAQAAQAQASGPPTSRLVPIPPDYDTSKAQLVDTDNVIYLLTKDVYRREIYKVATAPQPQVKYAVKETKMVSKLVPLEDWYEVEQAAPPAPGPTYEWKYAIRR
jgi:hypothetical protein